MKKITFILALSIIVWQVQAQTFEKTSSYKQYNIKPTVVDNSPPKIEITSPQNYHKTNASEITLTGTVSSQIGIGSFSINGYNVQLDENGSFSTQVNLKQGQNTIKLLATDRNWKKTPKNWQVIQTVSQVREGKDYVIVFATDYYNDYATWKKLPNAVSGGRKVAETLDDIYGFIPKVYEGLTRKEMEDYIYEMYDYLEPNDQIFIYISSHGDRDPRTKMGYLACKDSKGSDRATYMSHSYLSDLLNTLPTKHVFICIDACFSSTFDNKLANAIYASRGDRMVQGMNMKDFVSSKLKAKSRLYLTSGLTETSAGQPGQYSPFTKTLLQVLTGTQKDDGVLTFNEITAYFENEKLKPEPRAGEFGSNQPGGNFLFILK